MLSCPPIALGRFLTRLICLYRWTSRKRHLRSTDLTREASACSLISLADFAKKKKKEILSSLQLGKSGGQAPNRNRLLLLEVSQKKCRDNCTIALVAVQKVYRTIHVAGCRTDTSVTLIITQLPTALTLTFAAE